MFRILVADDEKIIRKGILTILKQGLMEEVEYLEASNGLEALDITQREMIHLVITDICMPLLSGLDFVRELRKAAPDMTVIIISGYENFEYARQAVKLGVKDYITKPIERDEFLGLVEKCIADILKKQMETRRLYLNERKNEEFYDEVRNETLHRLLEGKDTELCIQRLLRLKLIRSAHFWTACVVEYETWGNNDWLMDFVVKNMTDEILAREFEEETVTVVYESGCLAVVFFLMEMRRKKAERMLCKIIFTLEAHCRVKAISGMGNFVFSAEELPRSFLQSRIAADYKVYGENQKFVSYDAIQSGERITRKEMKIENVQDKQRELKTLLADSRDVDSLLMLRKIYEMLLAQVREWDPSGGNEEPEFRKFSSFWSPFELRREVRKICQYDEDRRKEQGNGDNHVLVNEISSFIKEHVTEDIDLNFVAEHFGKTPGYIGTVFKKGKGMGFNDFVTKERILLAKNLLKDPTISVSEAGRRCGYHNSKYFSVVFKKVAGISPKTYQKQKGGRYE